jgi:(+)-trans-carveol dehydrogenase
VAGSSPSKADVRNLEGLTAAIDAGVEELGQGLDIVCANAGVCAFGLVHELTESQWRDVIDVVLTGTRNTCRAAVPHMIAAGRGGSIIITSSAMGLMAYPGISNYVAAKHGVAGLMRAMAVELASARIRVNTRHPTAVDTPMIHNNATFSRFRPDLAEPTREDVAEAFASMNLLPDPWISVGEVSEAVVYFASDGGRNITGMTMTLDGGSLHRRAFGKRPHRDRGAYVPRRYGPQPIAE